MQRKKKRRNLIIARGKKKKTQREAAKDLGISEIYLRKIEAGDSNPGRDTMIKIANYYGEPMEKLFSDLFLLFSDTKIING